MCSDDDGSSEFSCTCKPQYLGERCEDDRCDIYQCQNNGTCIVALINDIPTPECECLSNYGGATCNLDLCLGIECGNGTCIGGNCQCDEDYVNDRNICVDICEGIDCGTGAECFGGNCTCQTGYANVENFCEETCALNPCKELIEN